MANLVGLGGPRLVGTAGAVGGDGGGLLGVKAGGEYVPMDPTYRRAVCVHVEMRVSVGRARRL